MRLEIKYSHLERSDATDAFVAEKAEALRHLVHRHDCHLQVWLVAEKSRFGKGVPAYTCEIELRYSPKRDVFVSKTAEDLHSAIIDAVNATKNLLRDNTQDHHHRDKPVLRPEPWQEA
jgi:ribosome-associated translation inhibitor RaiA